MRMCAALCSVATVGSMEGRPNGSTARAECVELLTAIAVMINTTPSLYRPADSSSAVVSDTLQPAHPLTAALLDASNAGLRSDRLAHMLAQASSLDVTHRS